MGLAGSQLARGGHRMGYTCLTWPFRRLGFENTGMRDRSRTPYMGNSRAKPMLSRGFERAPSASGTGPRAFAGSDHSTSLKEVLLPVACQHLAARGGQL